MTEDDELAAAVHAAKVAQNAEQAAVDKKAADRAAYDAREAELIASCIAITQRAISALNNAGNPGQINKQMETRRWRSDGIYEGWDWGPHLLRPDGAIFVGNARTPQTQKIRLEDWVTARIHEPRGAYATAFISAEGPYNYDNHIELLMEELEDTKKDLVRQLAELMAAVEVLP